MISVTPTPSWFLWRHETTALAAREIEEQGLLSPSQRSVRCGEGIGEHAGISERNRDGVYLYNAFSGYGSARDVIFEVQMTPETSLCVDEDVEGPDGVSHADYDCIIDALWSHRDDLSPLGNALSPEGIVGFSQLIREFDSEEDWEDWVHSADLWVRSALTGSVQTGYVPPSQLEIISGAQACLELVQIYPDGREVTTELPSDVDGIYVDWGDESETQEIWDEAYQEALDAVDLQYYRAVGWDASPVAVTREAVSNAMDSIIAGRHWSDASFSAYIEEI
jgi:hypothetical protein